MRGMTPVEILVRDVELAWRRLVRTPGFTAIAIISLALGIGVNTVMFSFVNAGLLRPLPFPDGDRLVMITMAPADNPGLGGLLPPPMFFLLRDQSRSFDAVGVYDGFPRSVSMTGDISGFTAEQLSGHRVSSTAFKALGLPPLLGRYHTPEEDLSGAARTIVLSHTLWQRRFAGRPDIVGQTAMVDGHNTTIIGVTPPAFDLFDGASDAWVAFGFEPAAAQGRAHWLRAVARLKPGVSLEQASAETQSLATAFERLFPDRGKWTLAVRSMDEALFGNMRQPLTLLQAAVGLVLLISCANLAALILTRAVGRQRELAVRSALGQSRASIVRQLMMESVLLSMGGGVLGAYAAWMTLQPLVALTPAWFPRLNAVTLDATVFAFCLTICLVACVGFGLIPAIQVSRPNLVQSLQEGGARASGSRSRMRQLQGLVVVQVTLAFVLLIGAGLMINTLVRLQNVDLGVDTSNLLSLRIQLARGQYMKENVAVVPGATLVDYSPAGRLLVDRIHEALQALPGVVHAAGINFPPLTGNLGGVPFRLDGTPASAPPAFGQYQFITANFFDTMKMRIVRGRDFNAGDQADSPWGLVVNEAFAREYWPGEDPLGKRLTFIFYNNDGERPREVVGVVADTPQYRGETKVAPLMYALHRQQLVRQRASQEVQRTSMAYVLRTAGDPMALAATVRAAVAGVDPAVPVMQMRTVESYLSAQLQGQRFIATLFGIFAAVALGIGVIGIYGVTSHAVSVRSREFGIRRALGAGAGNVLGLVIRRAVVILAVGVIVGASASLVLTRFLERFLWGVTRSDPATFAAIAVILVATGLIACIVPGSRAARVDPLVALRHE